LKTELKNQTKLMQDEEQNHEELLRILELKKRQLEVLKLEKENEKLEVEKDKIELEKAELSKAWYKKQAWVGTIITLLIGVAGVYVAFSTNIIGIQKLEKQKESLNETIQKQRDSVVLMTNLLTKAKTQYDILKNIEKSKEAKVKIDNIWNIIQFDSDSSKIKKRYKFKLDSIKERIKFYEELLNDSSYRKSSY
jgi:outer membrane protein OmpA-like peptidoglycan-associated protein